MDATGYTGEPGVYAAGDAESPLQWAIVAAAAGAVAAAFINRDLLAEDLELSTMPAQDTAPEGGDYPTSDRP